MSYLINSRKVTTLIFEDIETNKTAVNGTLYYSKDDNLAGIGLQDGSIQRIPDGRCRGGVYADLTDLNTNITDPAINDWAVVTDATGAIGTLDPNSKSYIVKWDGADWEIIYTDINDSAWVDTTNGILSTTVTTDRTANAGRSGDTQVSEGGRNIYISDGIGPLDRASNLNLINAESFSGRIETIGMGISCVKIDSYNSGGGEYLETYNSTQGNTSKALKNGSALRKALNFTGAHSNPNLPIYTLSLDRNNRSIGDGVVWETILQLFSEGRLRLADYGNGTFSPESYNYTFTAGFNGAGDFVEIPKSKWRRFENLSSISVPNNGLNNYTDLRSFTFTVLNNCSVIIFPTFQANQRSTSDQLRLKASIRVNGGTRIDATIESRVSDQGSGFGWISGVQDMIIREVTAGDSIEVIARGATDGNSNLIRTGFFIIEDHTMVQA